MKYILYLFVVAAIVMVSASIWVFRSSRKDRYRFDLEEDRGDHGEFKGDPDDRF